MKSKIIYLRALAFFEFFFLSCAPSKGKNNFEISIFFFSVRTNSSTNNTYHLLWLRSVCSCKCSPSYPAGRFPYGFAPAQRPFDPMSPPSHPSASLGPSLSFPPRPRTLCGRGCARCGEPMPRGDWAPRCTPQCLSCWSLLGCWTRLRGSCSSGEMEGENNVKSTLRM